MSHEDETAGKQRVITREDFLKVSAAGGSALLLGGLGGVGLGVVEDALAATPKLGAATINALFMQQAAYSNTDIQNMTKAFQKKFPQVKVNLTFVAYEALHDKIVTAAPAGTYDTVLMDVIWPAEFASKHMVVDITNRFPPSERAKIVGGALQTVEYKNKYYGVPWILDTKYFFFNRKMLQRAGVKTTPKTWDQVVTAAQAIKSKGIVKYPLVWSWSEAEALICDYVQLLGAFGGKFFNASGKPIFNTGGGLKALEFMRMTLDKGLSNPASTESLEEDVRKIVSQGQAAMALNWTYMYALANDPKESRVAGQIGVAHTPRGATGAPGVNGCMGMCIAAGSKHQDQAWEYIKFLTSQPVQNQYAKLSLPIWKSSYNMPKVLNSLPAVVPVAKVQLNNMILRPQVVQYNAISHILQVEIQNALLKRKTPQKALNDAAKQVVSQMQQS